MSQTTMDCWEALELLEGIHSGAIAADDSLAQQAQRHHETCAPCQAALPGRLKWNAGLTEAIADVAVPAELEVRLQRQLGPLVAERAIAAQTPARSRRWGILAMLTAAAVMLLVVWQAPWSSTPELVTRKLVEEHIGGDLSSLPVYHSEVWQPHLPAAWQSVFELRPELVHTFPATEDARQPSAAIVPFEYHNPALDKPIRGRLVMVPRTQYHSPPTNNDFFLAQVEYVTGFSVCIWTEGDWVFLCFVRSVNGGELHDLQRLMRDSRNFS